MKYFKNYCIRAPNAKDTLRVIMSIGKTCNSSITVWVYCGHIDQVLVLKILETAQNQQISKW